MNLEFIELDLHWSYQLKVLDLKNYILSELIKYGEPLRWAITSVTTHSKEKIQIISVEAVLVIHQEKGKGINPVLN